VVEAGHTPEPLQTLAADAVPSLHVPARHSTPEPGKAQASGVTPSHDPLQLVPSPAQGARPPCGAPLTGVQVPALAGTSQASHWPLQSVSQQTPSTQKPLRHSVGPPHCAPGSLFGSQMPAEHQLSDAQSASVVQSPRQVVVPQA
jgi:hypothetical protein